MARLISGFLSAAAFCWQWGQKNPYGIAIGIGFVMMAFLSRWATMLLGLILIAAAVKGILEKVFRDGR